MIWIIVYTRWVFFIEGCNIKGEDDSYDFGSGAGCYVHTSLDGFFYTKFIFYRRL